MPQKVESSGEKVESREFRFDSRLSTFSPPLLGLLSALFLRAERDGVRFREVVYQKSVDFADAVCQQTESFARGYGFLIDQLNRAAVSIAANIAEGNGRFTKPDRKHCFGIARWSVQECVPLLELAHRRGLISKEAHLELKSQLEEVSRMLSGLISGLENRVT